MKTGSIGRTPEIEEAGEIIIPLAAISGLPPQCAARMLCLSIQFCTNKILMSIVVFLIDF